ncbi:uroporphyrin-III C-methyltransferase [Methylophilaceae bacterium]|nr:uroporphyrin-III C-methyltransferase [Methylophilaceae bacterium]
MTNEIIPATETNNAETAGTLPAAHDRLSFIAISALILVILVICFSAWQWLNTRYRFTQLEQVLTLRLEQYGMNNQQTLTVSKLADERSVEASARIALLEQKLAESRNQQEALQTLYYELANTREERLIAEVEQLMTIASQQLQLAGSIKPALLALQTADARLQQIDTPQVIQLRKSLAQDIQRLQNLPLVDVVGMSVKLENLAESVNDLPLVSDRHPEPIKTVAPDWTSDNSWQKLLREIWQDIKNMVRLERIDRSEPPLLAPEQNYFLRENLKLRLLTARIALLQHDEETYRADLQAAEKWLLAYFDMREASAKSVLSTIRKLSSDNIVIQVPDINDSLTQISRYKLTLERGKVPEKSLSSGAR